MKSKIKGHDGKRVNLILTGASLVTLLFWTPAKDPFNIVKLWILILFGSYLLGQLISNFFDKSTRNLVKQLKGPYLAVGSFVLLSLVAGLMTDFKYTAFVGESQRNTGFIAYFFLSVFFLMALTDIDLKHVEKVFVFAIGLGTVMGLYGVMQHYGSDFIKWNNPYNSIISTVGNPDFAGAMMSILLVLSVASLFATSWNLVVKAAVAAQALMILIVIYWSNARQGLLSAAIGIGIFAVVFIWQRIRILGIISAAGGILVFFLGLLGIFQVGPLTHYLYKSSVTVRGYYWRAGIDMFSSNPWFGVGLDRYGAYFRSFRSPQYPVNYGYEITSTAAHNVLIQIFATGGIFVGLAYLSITGFVIYSGIQGIRKNQGNARLLVAGVFAAWVAYFAQSIVSIDNIGIAIWGWVLGGAVIGISRTRILEKLEEPQNKGRIVAKPQSSMTLAQPIISGVLVLAVFFLVIPMYKGETESQNVGRYAMPQTQSDRQSFHDLLKKTIELPLLNPNYEAELAVKFAQSGFVNESFNYLKQIQTADPESYTAPNIAADFYEQLKQPQNAIAQRLRLQQLDPWGAANLLKLAKDYLAVGNKAEAQKIGKKIIAMKARPEVIAEVHTALGV